MGTISNELKQKKIRRGIFKKFPVKIFVVTGLFIASLAVIILIVHEAVFENEAAFDNKVFAFFSHFESREMIQIMEYLTFFGSSTFLIPAYVALIAYFLLKHKYRYGLNITIVALSSTAIIFLLKNLVQRHRPSLPIIHGITNYSFPSGHALSAFIFCGIFVYIIWHAHFKLLTKWAFTILLMLFAITIGISRIVLRVHYPTDVIASFCLGNIWALSSLWLMRKLVSNNKTHEPALTETGKMRKNVDRSMTNL